jgi:hypothetical protein
VPLQEPLRLQDPYQAAERKYITGVGSKKPTVII